MENKPDISHLIGKYAGTLKARLDKLNDMILSWSIMLDAPDFLDTDAYLVQQEMLDYIVNGIKIDVVEKEGEQ